MGKINQTIKDADYEKIITLWHAGLGCSSIGLKLGYGHHTVKRFLDSRGYKRTQVEGLRAHVKLNGVCGEVRKRK